MGEQCGAVCLLKGNLAVHCPLLHLVPPEGSDLWRVSVFPQETMKVKINPGAGEVSQQLREHAVLP